MSEEIYERAIMRKSDILGICSVTATRTKVFGLPEAHGGDGKSFDSVFDFTGESDFRAPDLVSSQTLISSSKRLSSLSVLPGARRANSTTRLTTRRSCSQRKSWSLHSNFTNFFETQIRFRGEERVESGIRRCGRC